MRFKKKDLMFAASEQTANIRRTFAIGAKEAEIMRRDVREVAALNEDYLATSHEILAAQDAINKAIGGQYNLVQNASGAGATLVRQYAQAKDILKLSDNALNGILKASLQTGKEFRDIQKQVIGTAAIQAKQLGIQVNYREVMEQVGSASEKVKGDFGGTLDSLTKGVVTLTKFGMTLQNISNIQQGLLDFETSFANELKAELLSGQEMNLDRARYLAMTRQTEELSKEINALGFTKAKLDKMNTFELEAQAQMLHMQSDELYDMVTRRENLNKLTDLARVKGKKLTEEELKSETLVLEALQKQGLAREAIAKEIGDQALANLEAQSASDKFERAMSALKDKLEGMVSSGLIDRLIATLERFVSLVGPSANTVKTQSNIQALSERTGAGLQRSSFSGTLEAKDISKLKVGSTQISEDALADLGKTANMGYGIAPRVLESLSQGKLSEKAIQQLNKAAEEGSIEFFQLMKDLNFSKQFTIQAEDFVIKTHPKDTLVMAGGTRLGEGVGSDGSQQPVFHAQIVMPNGAVLAKTTFDYASTNNYTM